MADGMPGMPWKEALKRLKEYHQAGADGSPASMQKELEGLEESLKGWETRDERRDRTLDVYRQDAEKLRAERGELTSKLESAQQEIERLKGPTTCKHDPQYAGGACGICHADALLQVRDFEAMLRRALGRGLPAAFEGEIRRRLEKGAATEVVEKRLSDRCPLIQFGGKDRCIHPVNHTCAHEYGEA